MVNLLDQEIVTLEIPYLNLTKLSLTIIGRTPLITCRFSEESATLIEEKQTKKARQVKPARDPHKEFLNARHVVKQGSTWEEDVCGFPAIGVKECLVSAGKRVGEEKGTILMAALNIVGDFLTIRSSGPPTMRRDFVIHHNVGSLAYRPQWWPWEIDVQVDFLNNVISEAQVINLFRMAGFANGIGSWRIERKGTMGQFEIKEGSIRILSRTNPPALNKDGAEP